MKNTLIFAAAIFAAGTAQISIADGHVKSKHGSMGTMMTKMDTDSDGMLSKKEFMNAHEAMFERMKGKNGMISLKDMEAHHEGKMDHCCNMKDHKNMESEAK